MSLPQLKAALNSIKAAFVDKDEVIELLGIGLLAGENLFLYGPPGTAKSALVRHLGLCLEGGRNFEYLLTRFTEPGEVFGPFDLRKLREGELLTNTQGMLPEADLVFLDELFNANSAILNSLLLALNERQFRRGQESRPIPALMFVGASNMLPQDPALEALYDRFLIRVLSDNVAPEHLEQVLLAGRRLERAQALDLPQIAPAAIRALQAQVKALDLSPIYPLYLELIRQMRQLGLQISDRRAVKIQNLIAASALYCGREQAQAADLWVLRYIWDNPAQAEALAALVDKALASQVSAGPLHPLTEQHQAPKAETLAADLEGLAQAWPKADAAERSRLKDRLRHLHNRSQWLSEGLARQSLQDKIEALWRAWT